MSNHKRSGISSVVSAALVIVMVFAVLIPALLFTQSLYSLLSNEVNSRRIFDVDRSSEDLAVYVTQNNGVLYIILSNKSPIHVSVFRVWAIDVSSNRPLPSGDGPCINNVEIGLRPGENASVNVGNCVTDFTGCVKFIVVTGRGRLFSSETVRLVGGRFGEIVFPYALTVSIINMKRGSTYSVTVSPLGNGEAEPKKIVYKATASNENVTLAFGVTAGKYRVELYENDKLVPLGDQNPQIIDVPDVSAVVFNLKRIVITPVDLIAGILAPKKVKSGDQFTVFITVELPNEAQESVEITTVTGIQIVGSNGSTCNALSPTLRPGATEIAAICMVNAGKSGITITVPSDSIKGVGLDSGLTYTNTNSPSQTVRVVGGPPTQG
jgi:hypothetical protein